MRKNQGITLVALIITIIIMLILVAVSVNILIKSNLIATAEKTANGYKTAQDREANGSPIEINGKKYASLEDYQAGKEYIASNIPGGTKVDKNTEYKIEGETRTAVIPAGFTISGLNSERTIEGGLVIYDIPDGAAKDWTNPDSVKTKYNQFVWIPVEVNKTTEPKDTETSIKKFARTAWAANEETGGDRTDGLDTNYTEPYAGDPTNDYDGTGEGKTGIAAQITELTKSIYQYGGFWIGRYEAGVKPAADGTETARTSGSSQTDPFIVQQDKYPYNYIKWGTDMGDISKEGAVFLCNNLYNTTDYGAKSMLCTGAVWDSMLDFIKDKDHNVKDSNKWGNYSNVDFTIIRGKWASSDSPSNFTPVKGTYIKEKYSATKKVILLTTGAAEKRNVAKNIYDVAGNCYEWTTEAGNTNSRILRGGGCDYNGSGYPASDRGLQNPTYSNNRISFRPLLYVTL